MAKLVNILEGWANVIKSEFGKLSPELQREAGKRMEICDTCDLRSGHICSPLRHKQHKITGNVVRGCGCVLLAKAMSPDEHCPAGEW